METNDSHHYNQIYEDEQQHGLHNVNIIYIKSKGKEKEKTDFQVLLQYVALLSKEVYNSVGIPIHLNEGCSAGARPTTAPT